MTINTSLQQYTYASIDIETLGLNYRKHKVIEIAIVLDNHLKRISYSNITDYVNNLPFYHCYIKYDNYKGDKEALSMNRETIDLIENNKVSNIISIEELPSQLQSFLSNNLNSKIMPAGKNFAGFDRQFLNNIPKVQKVLDDWFIHRTLDPAILFFNENLDVKLPNLQECLERSNFKHVVNHTALEDAKDVIKCLRYKWDFIPINPVH